MVQGRFVKVKPFINLSDKQIQYTGTGNILKYITITSLASSIKREQTNTNKECIIFLLLSVQEATYSSQPAAPQTHMFRFMV